MGKGHINISNLVDMLFRLNLNYRQPFTLGHRSSPDDIKYFLRSSGNVARAMAASGVKSKLL